MSQIKIKSDIELPVPNSKCDSIWGRFGQGLLTMAIAGTLVMMAPVAMSKPKDKTPKTDDEWSEWEALGEGYVGRRKEPKKKKKDEEAANDSYELSLGEDEIKALWLRTGIEGLYEANITDLAADLNVDESIVRKHAKKGKLSIVNVGKQISWYFDESNDSILFAGKTHDTFFTSLNAYRFSAKKGKRMKKKGKNAINNIGNELGFSESLKFEEEPAYMFPLYTVASEPDVDYWFWNYIWASNRPFLDIPLTIPDPAGNGSAQLRASFRGFTDMYDGDEHHLTFELNGQAIGDPLIWDGFTGAETTINFDPSILNSNGSNTFRINSIYSGAETPGQFLDEINVDYLRMPVAVNDQLWMHGVEKGVQKVVGFTNNDIMVIESPDSNKATILNDARIDPDGTGGYSVTFKVKKDGKDYLVVDRGVEKLPAIEADIPSNLVSRNNQAEYLIISSREFSGTALALAEYRSARFSKVRIVWSDDIYDVFSHGRVDPYAIPFFMGYARYAWKTPPSVVMILGKGTIDHKDRMGFSDSFIPTLMTANPWALTASDNRLISGEDISQAAIGRLPILTDAEGLDYLDKLIAYESATPGVDRYKAALIAEEEDPNAGDFPANSDLLACRLTGSPDCGVGLGFTDVSKYYEPDTLYGDIHDELIAPGSFEKGYFSYDGHGSAFGLGNLNYLTPADAAGLTNTELPIFTALTCAAANFTFPGVRSVIGSLVLNPDGGSIASMAPTGLSLDQPAQVLGNNFVDSLYGSNNYIGDAAKDAKVLSDIEEFMRTMYVVIGEPTIYGR